MRNNNIIDIFKQGDEKIQFYPSLFIDENDLEDLLSSFGDGGIHEVLNGTMPDYISEAELLSYRIITSDVQAIEIASSAKGATDAKVWNNNRLTAITDRGVYFKPFTAGTKSFEKEFRFWKDIDSVESDGDLIVFHGKNETALPAISVCDKDLVNNEEDFRIFVNMLDMMAKDGKPVTKKPKKTKAGKAENEKKGKNGSETKEFASSKYEANVTEKNVCSIITEGKSLDGDIDLSAVSSLDTQEEKLKSLKEKNVKSSKLGSLNEIEAQIEKFKSGLKKLEGPKSELEQSKKAWEEKAVELFGKAVLANVRILLGKNEYSLSVGTGDTPEQPGLYATPSSVERKSDLDGLPEEIAQDIKSRTDEILPLWQKYLEANNKLWQVMSEISGKKKFGKQIQVSQVLEDTRNTLEKNRAIAAEYEEYQTKLNSLESEVAKLRKLSDQVIASLSEIDPMLTAYTLPEGVKKYDGSWLEMVKKSAESRKTMPYLPLFWQGRQFGSVFNWQQAIKDGKPNLFIEAATDEGSEGRIDMLDTFMATILLAFPVKQVHFTVLENRTINPFVKNLPEKVCKIYDAMTDREAIGMFVKQLKDQFSASRNNRVDDCCPKEIVVIAGFDRGDRVFTDLMGQLKEIVENGRRAGIYFAIVLSNDFTEYDWKEKDANDFEKFFIPYSTILTTKKDKEGNPIPDYNLLNREATVETEDGVRNGTLADLIVGYLTRAVSTIPNKVYDLIETGEMYKSKPVVALDNQPKKDAGSIVVPIAQTEEGELLNMRFDDESYISCFILGRSGMGKSFTLHTILTNMMLKYDPKTVEVILMDFKPGGVEMNYYKDVPHVSSLLVNGADKQVAGEILLSIMREMERRGEVFQKYDVSSIGRYNTYAAKNGLEQMKHIVMLVDECQDLFKVENPNSDTNIVTDIARKGRSYGIHMVLATQTLQKTDIPSDALAQFSDFLFMGCKEEDVVKCEINGREVQKRVGELVKGEVIYCHRAAAPVHGYVFNYYGKKGEYRDATRDNLQSKRFSKPSKKQFYFNASQVYNVDKAETDALLSAAKSGLNPTPMTLLGKNLSVKCDTSYTRMSRIDGANLLVLGANNLLQAERVLWNAAVSLYDCNKALDKQARFYLVPNIPEDVESGAREAHQARMDMLRRFIDRPGVTMIDDTERLQIIERVAATVRLRQQLAESDRSAVNALDEIFLVIANQDRCSRLMSKKPRGLASLDDNLATTSHADAPKTETKAQAETASSDSLGFEGLVMPGSEPETSSGPDFMGIDFGSFDSPAAAPSAPALSPGKPGRDYDEELKYALEYGPVVGVHILLQSSGPDKIYAEDAMRQKEMTMLFNDIIFLKMLQAEGMSIPVDDREVKNLSADPGSLRAIVYNGDRGMRTIVPFDFPKLKV